MFNLIFLIILYGIIQYNFYFDYKLYMVLILMVRVGG